MERNSSIDNSWVTVLDLSVEKQADSNNCGVYTVINMANSCGIDIFSAVKDNEARRKQIAMKMIDFMRSD